MGRRRARTAIGPLILVALAAAVELACAPAVPAAPTVATFALNPDLQLKTTRLPTKPLEVRELRLDPATDAVPDIVPASTHYPLYTLTSTMAAHAGALAAINGDFGTPRRQPTHALMIDGELWTSGVVPGDAIGWSEDGSTMDVGRAHLQIRASRRTGTALFPIAAWNTDAKPTGTVSGYTARGGTVTQPPGVTSPTGSDPAWCEAQLLPVGSPRFAHKKASIVRRYTVAAQPDPCQKTPLAVGTTQGAVVVATAATSGAHNPVQDLHVGQTLRISTRFEGWPGVTDVMGGVHMLVERGVNVAQHYVDGDPYIFDRNPRTAAGITKGCSDLDPVTSCRLFLVTVDGRQATTDWSTGVRLPYLARLMLDAGSWMAVNLDGGGSTTMWTKATDAAYCQSYPSVGGCLVMRPSQPTGERATRTAIDILGSPDTGAPSTLR